QGVHAGEVDLRGVGVEVRVDKARQQRAAGEVDGAVGRGRDPADLGDAAGDGQDVALGDVVLRVSVPDAGVFQQQAHGASPEWALIDVSPAGGEVGGSGSRRRPG